MNEIRTYSDLLQEKEKLEALLVTQKKLIHQDFTELKEEYKPAIDLLSSVSKITHRDKTNPLIAMGVNLAGEILIKNMLLSKSNKVVQFTVPFIAKKITHYVLAKGIGNIFSKLFGRLRKNKPTEVPSLNGNQILE